MRIQSVAFSFTLTICLALAASCFAFVAGREAANPEARYEQGVEEGERAGRAQARADFAPGSDAYVAALDEGRRRGFTAGRAAGRRDGARAGRMAGRRDAFARFPGGWDIGRWYLVNIRPGDDGAEYAIGARVRVDGETWYGICRRVHICRRRR